MDKNRNIKDREMKEYKIEQRRGFEGIGDFEMEWLTIEEQEVRWETHRKRIENLKKSGEYGEKYTLTISIEEDEILDKPTEVASPSFSYLIWDINENI